MALCSFGVVMPALRSAELEGWPSAGRAGRFRIAFRVLRHDAERVTRKAAMRSDRSTGRDVVVACAVSLALMPQSTPISGSFQRTPRSLSRL